MLQILAKAPAGMPGGLPDLRAAMAIHPTDWLLTMTEAAGGGQR